MSKVTRVGRCAAYSVRFWNASGPWRSDGRDGGRARQFEEAALACRTGMRGRGAFVPRLTARARFAAPAAAKRESPRRNLARQPVAPLFCRFFGTGSPVVFGDGADRKRTGSVMNSERICGARCARKKLPSPPVETGSTRLRGLQTMRRHRRPASRSRRSGRERESANGGLFVRETELSAGPPGENDLPPAAPNSRATGDRALAERTAVPPCPIPVPGRPATGGAVP